jgi:hypothetical protein
METSTMTVPDNLKPMEMDGAEYVRNRYRLSVAWPTTWGDILADRTFFKHLMLDARLIPGVQAEIASVAGLFDCLIHVDAVDRASHSVDFRVLRAYEAPRVPEAELTASGMGVQWLGDNGRWAIVALSPDEGAGATIRSGYATEKLAAAGLALLAGTNKKRAKAAA